VAAIGEIHGDEGERVVIAQLDDPVLPAVDSSLDQASTAGALSDGPSPVVVDEGASSYMVAG